MKSRLDLRLVAAATGATAGVVYLVCAIAYLLLPKPAFDLLWKPVLHWLYGASAGTIALGLVEVIVYAILTAAAFVLIYNYLLEREKE